MFSGITSVVAATGTPSVAAAQVGVWEAARGGYLERGEHDLRQAALAEHLTPLGFRKRDAYCAAQRRKGAAAGAAQTGGNKADPTLLCELSVRCTALVSRWARIEGLRGRAVIGAKGFYLNGCLACHRYLGDGRTRFAAPDLTAEGRRNRGVEWQIELLRCPSCVLAGIPMPRAPFIRVRDVAFFLEASKGRRHR